MVSPELHSKVLLGVALGKGNDVVSRLCGILNGEMTQASDTFQLQELSPHSSMIGMTFYVPLTATVLPGLTVPSEESVSSSPIYLLYADSLFIFRMPLKTVTPAQSRGAILAGSASSGM